MIMNQDRWAVSVRNGSDVFVEVEHYRVRTAMYARRCLQHVAESSEESGSEHARAEVLAIGESNGGRGARGSWGGALVGGGRLRSASGLSTGSTSGGWGGSLGWAAAAVGAAAGTRATSSVVTDVEETAVVLDVGLALALSDGVVGVSVDAAGEVGLADEVGEGVLVVSEIGGGAVGAEAAVGQFLL